MDQMADRERTLAYSEHDTEQALRILREDKPYSVESPDGAIISLRLGVCVPDRLTFDFIQYCDKFIAAHTEIKTIADLGTGSGVIAISLAKLHPDRQFKAFDISPEALELAGLNAARNNLDNLFLSASHPGHWIPPKHTGKIDLIISNPPFIGTEEWSSPDLMTDFPDCRYQPELAMRAHDLYGLSEYLAITREAAERSVKWVIFRANGDYIDKLEAALKPQVASLDLQHVRGKCPVLVALRPTPGIPQ